MYKRFFAPHTKNQRQNEQNKKEEESFSHTIFFFPSTIDLGICGVLRLKICAKKTSYESLFLTVDDAEEEEK
jgi:hypothetical protein